MVTNMHEPNVLQYNRILLPDMAAFRAFTDQDDRVVAASIDGSVLQFLFEELISRSVVEIVIDAHSLIARAIGTVPAILRKRVIVVNKNQKSAKRLSSILAPVFEEFGMKDFNGNAQGFTFKRTDQLSDEIQKELLFKVFLPLLRFLIALEIQAQTDVDVKQIQSALTSIKRRSRSPESRAVLAVLNGIFETYKSSTISSLNLIPTAPERLVEYFHEFIQDASYREMSRQSHLLGFPAHLKRSATLVNRLSKKIITKSPFKEIVTLGSKAISTSTQIPLPDSAMAASLLQKKYLPPIINLDDAIEEARHAWKVSQPEHVDIGGLDISDDWSTSWEHSI
jgi:hypothetical protein